VAKRDEGNKRNGCNHARTYVGAIRAQAARDWPENFHGQDYSARLGSVAEVKRMCDVISSDGFIGKDCGWQGQLPFASIPCGLLGLSPNPPRLRAMAG